MHSACRVLVGPLVWVGLVAPCFAQNQLAEAAREVVSGRSDRLSFEVTDGFAHVVRKATKSDARVYADVFPIKAYAQPNCKRVRIELSAPEAMGTDPATGAKQPFKYQMEMDLCADGRPPALR